MFQSTRQPPMLNRLCMLADKETLFSSRPDIPVLKFKMMLPSSPTMSFSSVANLNFSSSQAPTWVVNRRTFEWYSIQHLDLHLLDWSYSASCPSGMFCAVCGGNIVCLRLHTCACWRGRLSAERFEYIYGGDVGDGNNTQIGFEGFTDYYR